MATRRDLPVPRLLPSLTWLRRPEVLVVISSAPTYVATSEVLRVLKPADLTPLRFLTAAVLLGTYLSWRRGGLGALGRAIWPDRWRVLGISILGYGVYGTLLNVGQTTVAAGTASLLLNMSPVFAAICGFLFLGERSTTRGLSGMAIAIAGTALVALSGTRGIAFDWYALIIVAAALVLAIFLVAQQPLLSRVNPIELVFWGCLVGGLVTAPYASYDIEPTSWSLRTWVALGYLVLAGTVIAYSYWNLTLAATSVSKGGALLFAVPIFSLTLGWLLLDQVPSIGCIIGGLVALGGVIVIMSADAKAPHTSCRTSTPPSQPRMGGSRTSGRRARKQPRSSRRSQPK